MDRISSRPVALLSVKSRYTHHTKSLKANLRQPQKGIRHSPGAHPAIPFPHAVVISKSPDHLCDLQMEVALDGQRLQHAWIYRHPDPLRGHRPAGRGRLHPYHPEIARLQV